MQRLVWQRNLWVLSAGVFIAQVGFSMVVSFLPIYLTELGTTRDVALWSGLVFAVTSLTYALVAPLWGAFTDRYGKRAIMLRSGLGIAGAYLLMAVATNHWQLFAIRGLMGLLSGFCPAAIMLVASDTPDEHLGPALGAVQTAASVGGISGPLIGGIIAEAIGGRATFVVAAAIVGLAGILSAALTSERLVRSSKPVSMLDDLRQAFTNPRLSALFVSLLLAQAAILAMQPALPLIIGRMVRTNVTFTSGLVFSLLGLATAIGAPLVSRMATPGQSVRIYKAGVAVAALLSALQAVSPSVLVLGGLRFFYGFANAAIVVTGNVLVARRSDPASRGRAFGILNSMTALGAVLGPLVGGMLANRVAYQASFYGGAALLLAAWISVARERDERTYSGSSQSPSTCRTQNST